MAKRNFYLSKWGINPLVNFQKERRTIMKNLGGILFRFLILLIVILNLACGEAIAQTKPAGTSTVLKISHQWTGGTIDKGDYLDRLCWVFAKKVGERTKGALKFEIYPSSSLFKPVPQYDAMLSGALDMSVYPMDYASGKIPQMSITHMPCTVKDYYHGLRWKDAPIGKEIDKLCEDNGMKILTWVWARGGIGSRAKLIKLPADAKGLKFRAAGKFFEIMLYKGAGAAITSMPSSEIYMAFQTGILDAALTGNKTFVSFKLYEQIQYFTSTRKAALFHMFSPLLISMVTFKKLSAEHQKVIIEAGKEMNRFVIDEGIKADIETFEELEKYGVKVYDMSIDEYKAWTEVSKNTAWKEFAAEVKGGKELMDMALAVK